MLFVRFFEIAHELSSYVACQKNIVVKFNLNVVDIIKSDICGDEFMVNVKGKEDI